MVTGDHLGKLLDFGIAQLSAKRSRRAARQQTEVALTEAGRRHRHARLHVARAAPRQAARRTVGPLLARRGFLRGDRGPPGVPGDNPAERIAANLSAEFEPLGAAGVPADAAVVLARAMARDPERRYPSAAAFLADLRALALGRVRWPRCPTRSRSSISETSRAILTTTGSAADSPRASPSISRGSPAFRSFRGMPCARAAAEAGEQAAATRTAFSAAGGSSPAPTSARGSVCA